MVRPVHPHACGEYAFLCAAVAPGYGSPPRLWGILRIPVVPVRHERFTPTPVGNTPANTASRPNTSVHPHACGEYVGGLGGADAEDGSPPRLWGIRRRPRRRGCRGRFTPTPVGNTCNPNVKDMWTAVHPHACGEYSRRDAQSACQGGSPPRLWGIRRPSAAYRRTGRFTPTPVGNTCGVHGSGCAAAVHPHACGEYMRDALCQISRGGSPPRLWGIRPG